MKVEIFRFTSHAMNATVYEDAQEEISDWLQRMGSIKVISTAQSTHTRPDTDNELLVDLIISIYYQ